MTAPTPEEFERHLHEGPTLPEFILARVAEEERPCVCMERNGACGGGWCRDDCRVCSGGDAETDNEWTLTQCAAYRTIVALHSEDREGIFHRPVDYECTGTYDTGMSDPEDCATLRALAAMWSDHPDYRFIADMIDPRPCHGANANVCAAEGCFGEECTR